jgi:IclR family transcriptional regulator, acetate operon repressor
MSASGTQAVDRAAELLSLVVGSAGAPQFSELVAGTGLPKSTASRLLQALERHHLLYRDDQGGYSPGALFVGYTARHDPVDQLTRLAGPGLQDLNARTGETVNLAVAHGTAVVQVTQIDATFVLGVTNWVGVEVPAHCSALGKVCYAYGGLAVPGRLARRTARTITSPAELRRQLDEVVRRGYATTHGELEVGLDGVAAPVLGPGGELVAAVGISGPTERIAPQLGDLAELLINQAAELSSMLGHHRAAVDNPTHDGPVHEREGAA